MPIITQTDLSTHIYSEVIEQIVRNDDTIVTRAINAAVQEAKMYLARYDLFQLFGDNTTTPAVQDEMLKSLVKDITCWHILRLANTNIDLAAFRKVYEDAVGTLKAIMQGDVNPQGWPYLDTKGETTPQGDAINWSSNPKRNNYY